MSMLEGFSAVISAKLASEENLKCKFKAFSSKQTRNMNLYLYLDDLQYHLGIPDEIVAIAYENLLLFLNRNKDFPLTKLTVHRLTLISLILTYKFSSDFAPSLALISQIGCIPKKEYRRCELAFLKGVNWELKNQVSPDTIELLIAQSLKFEKDDDLFNYEDLKPEDNDIESEISAFFKF